MSTQRTRLYVVSAIFVAATLVLWVRLVQVQVFAGNHYDDIAESQWKVTREVPAVRGGVFDREGRPLALSIRSCSVGARPRDIQDGATVLKALSKYLGMRQRDIKRLLAGKDGFVWIKRKCHLSEEERAELSRLRGIDVHYEADRVYPFGATAAKVVGFIGQDNRGMAGVEAAFDEELKGVPGWEEVQRDGRYRSRGYRTYESRPPQNGKHVILTIDARLQEAAEYELQRAVQRTGATSGGVIVMKVDTGEILSLAEYPAAKERSRNWLADSLWTIRCISNIYEPGSTFKLVTAAALIESDNVRSFDIFDGENGKAKIRSARISDTHEYGHLTFREAFVFSSNIVMAKASLKLEPDEFFKFVRLFGFGSETGIRLLGESGGTVKDVADWSDRTQLTMAFGQEIAVTPLQMVNAYAAIANDGVLMVPRIVRSIVDETEGEARDTAQLKVRRVVSTDTARELRSYCRSVVEEGTGTKAEIGFIAVAGKTGTAEKASARGGYLPGAYVASFIGFAPHDDPTVVTLVLLDEPQYDHRFGGVSAAPVFARLNEIIAQSSDLYDVALSSEQARPFEAPEDVFEAPNFLRQGRTAAMERARRMEINVLCQGKGSVVVAQDPDPGVAMGQDDVMRLYLGTGEAGDRVTVPDLRGLPMRMARRRATEAGLRCTISGTGVVTSQSPSPGSTAKKGVVTLVCKARTGNG